MIFAEVAPDQALGGILAHSVQVKARRLKKGIVLGPDDIAALQAAGITGISVAQLEPGDVAENDAAAALAQALLDQDTPAGLAAASGAAVGKAGACAHLEQTPAFTGRVNLLASGPGVAVLDIAAIEAVNLVHPMITLATVPPFAQMRAGGMVATIKIISYAVSGRDLARACVLARGAIRLARPVLTRADLIVTTAPGGAGQKGVDAIHARLDALGVNLENIIEISHNQGELQAKIQASTAELLLILTASATSDIADVAPAALVAAGGTIERFGMPVDPGNLLFFGTQAGRAVIGLPGCARSVALNGADWVLSRIVCGQALTSAEVAAMGVGGLLKEIPSRPQPRRPRGPSGGKGAQ